MEESVGKSYLIDIHVKAAFLCHERSSSKYLMKTAIIKDGKESWHVARVYTISMMNQFISSVDSHLDIMAAASKDTIEESGDFVVNKVTSELVDLDF